MAEESLSFPHLRAVLEEYAKQVVETYRRNIVQSDALATEQLYNTVEYELAFGDVRIEVQLHLAPHWEYSEEDTRPHWAPSQAIKDWVRIKGIEYEDKAISRASYFIRKKIAEEGTKGTHDLHNALEEVDRLYTDRILAALKEDVEEGIAAVLYKAFGR